jgi:3-methylcrotonyl-CoA carboxylase alpha subunit
VFGKLLIANRGEIACRIMRTARRLGIATVAVYSEADRDALHVRSADEAVAIGPAPARASYLNIDAIIDAARASGAEAVHPGYGFLSENPDFAEVCAAAGIVFVGPPAAAIRAMGSKAAAKALMARHGLPLVPGYHGDQQQPARLFDEATRLGFPVLIKASAGGGGRGMRVVEKAEAFLPALESARREATSAFGDDRVLLERYLARPRHIEVQVFADSHGNFVHLFERDCSIQRRYQKVVEEAPAPGLDAEQRREMGQAAITAARAVGYVGAGTVEFITEGEDAFYFMEMNTRLQVEHSVTEAVTGQDLVEWQLRVAAGEPLPLAQQELACHGHAIEARLYAEDPERNFLPQTGVLHGLRLAPADLARVDAGVAEGDAVTPHYDPMLAKIIVHGDDRAAALRRLRRALAATAVLGVTTNLGFLARLAAHLKFAAAALDTGFIDRHRDVLAAPAAPAPDLALAAATLLRLEAHAAASRRDPADPFSPWARGDSWRLAGLGRQQVVLQDGMAERTVRAAAEGDGWRLDIDGRSLIAAARRQDDGALLLRLDGETRRLLVLEHAGEVAVFAEGGSWRFAEIDPLAARAGEDPSGGRLTSPMPGRVTQLYVAAGDVVSRGAALAVVEAMKMEHTIRAAADGVVAAVHVRVGDQVEEGVELIALAAPDEAGPG